MSRIYVLATVAGLALAFAASAASAQTAGMHSPPSDRAIQGSLIDPNDHLTTTGIIDPNERSINYANGQTPRGYKVGGAGGGHGSERMGIVIEERKLVGKTSETFTPTKGAQGAGGGGGKAAGNLRGAGENAPF